MALVKTMPNKALDKLRAQPASGIEHFDERLTEPEKRAPLRRIFSFISAGTTIINVVK